MPAGLMVLTGPNDGADVDGTGIEGGTSFGYA